MPDATSRNQRKPKFYSSPSSSPWLDVGAPPSIDGTPAGGAAFVAFGEAACFALPPAAGFFAAALPGPVFAAFAGFAGFLAAFRAGLAFFAFFAVFPAAFFVVLVFLAPFFAVFFPTILGSSFTGDLHDLNAHLRSWTTRKNMTRFSLISDGALAYSRPVTPASSTAAKF